MDAPTASRTDAPASPRVVAYITVRLYWMSGEFILEDHVPWYRGVERYVQDLEEGLVDPSLCIEQWSQDDPWEDLHGYTLVWKDMELQCGRKFIDFVEDHGMPVDEPVDIMVVMTKLERGAVGAVDEC